MMEKNPLTKYQSRVKTNVVKLTVRIAERITCILKDKQRIFEGIWNPMIEYVKNSDLENQNTD